MSSYFKFSHFIHRIFATQIRKPIPFTFQHSNFSDKATPVVSLKNSVIFSTPQPSQSDLISESADGNLPSIISPKLSDVIAKLSRELDTLPEDSSSSPSHIRPLPSALMAPVGNLAALVNECAALQRLMCEGIDLAALEAVPGVPNFLVKLDVEREIEPLVLFLSDTNRLALSCATGPALDSPAREPTQVGTVLQAAPRLLQVSIEVLSSIDEDTFYSYSYVNVISLLFLTGTLFSNDRSWPYVWITFAPRGSRGLKYVSLSSALPLFSHAVYAILTLNSAHFNSSFDLPVHILHKSNCWPRLHSI